jgi:hypothetical protein
VERAKISADDGELMEYIWQENNRDIPHLVRK